MDLDWIGGVYAPPNVERTPEMKRALALSDELIMSCSEQTKS